MVYVQDIVVIPFNVSHAIAYTAYDPKIYKEFLNVYMNISGP